MKTNTIISLTVVLGLLIGSSNSAPILQNHVPLQRRDDTPQACPGTLGGPSGNAYFTFSTNLSNNVAQQACASCHSGVLADVSVADLEFLSSNVEQGSWIKSWNGDDYSSSCVTLQSSSGTPSVGIDTSCISELWPLCVAQAHLVDDTQRLEMLEGNAGVSLSALAVPYSPSVATKTPNVAIDSNVSIPEVGEVDKNASVPGEDVNVNLASSPSPEVASPEITPTVTEDDKIQSDGTGPLVPEVTSPRAPHGEGQDVDVEVIEVVAESLESVTGPVLKPDIQAPTTEESAPASGAPAP
ncbi:hypothetical protein BGZ65_007830, partial [Modicella reniformis]